MAADWSILYESEAEGITAIAVQVLVIIVLSFALLHFLGVPNRKKKLKKLRGLLIFSFLLSIGYCISNLTFHSIMTFVYDQDINCRYRSWTMFLLLFQRVSLYWFLLLRLKITFERTILAIKPYIITTLYILTFSFITAAVVFSYYSQYKEGCNDTTQIRTLMPIVIIDTIWCIFLSIWFVSKLQNTIVQFQNGDYIDATKLMLICKLTNIVVWSSIIIQLAEYIFAAFSGWVITGMTLNALSTQIALLFTFKTYNVLYEKWVCLLCHQCIIKCCKIKLKMQIKKQSQRKLKQQMISARDSAPTTDNELLALNQ